MVYQMFNSEVIKTLDQYADRYDGWFDRHPAVFQSELEALKKVIPNSGEGLDMGVGSGRFAAALGIKTGVDPSVKLSALARSRGINVFEGMMESLPFKNQQFDYILLCTTLCYVRVPMMALQEAKRVLKPNGLLIIGMIDKNSKLGQAYLAKKQDNPLYRYANFYSVNEIQDLLYEINFKTVEIFQTVFSPLNEIQTPEQIKPGHGQGGFVVISAKMEEMFRSLSMKTS